MILSDQHMHSTFSDDSKAEMHDMINAAIIKGLKTICFTDHYDPLFPGYLPGNEGIFDLDVDRYMIKAKEIRNNALLQSKINVRLGIELGIYPEVNEVCRDIIRSADFDFVILSSHTAKKIDPYFPSYWEGITSYEGIRMYFEEILENVRNFDDFDVYGHMDYVVRYTESTPEDRDINKYKEILEEIFKVIISKGKGIEINSGGLRSKLKEFNPSPDILKLYKDCGGEIITFGSDAHKCEDIAYESERACDLLKSTGFNYVAEFRERKPEFIKI